MDREEPGDESFDGDGCGLEKEREECVGARGKPLGKAMAPERAKEAVSKTSP
jgi:hypothetical protein